jgi:hypothetical protein
VTFEVLETMFFLFPESVEEDALQLQGPCLQAWVPVNGPQTFRLGLTVTQNLARIMATNFLGTTEKEISKERMEDVLKETANMMGGAFLSRLQASQAFHLLVPQARWVSLKDTPEKPSPHRLLFEVEEEALEIFIEKG